MKTFNIFKYKPKGNELLEKSLTDERPAYAELLKATKNRSKITSKIKLNNYKTNKNIGGKLHSLSPTIRTRKQVNIPLWNNSNTNITKDDKYQQEINKLKEEIKSLKQSNKHQHDPKLKISRNNINLELKNENLTFVFHDSQQENMELITIISLSEQITKTLSNYGEQLKNTTGLQSNPVGQVINLIIKWFAKETFNLLNKNLNFVPTQTNFNKTTLNRENRKIFTGVLNSKPILKTPKSRLALLKNTYSESQQTKPGFQITITTV